MKPNELYNHIWEIQYNKSGFDLDWQLEVDSEERKIRLLFQPSSSWKDWFINIAGFLPIFKFPLFYCWGWKTVYDEASPVIYNTLFDLYTLYPDHKVEICGHSYGGAQAVIAGIDISRRLGIKPDVITFGAPKPLFLLYSKLIGEQYINAIQYAHRSDVVTLMPPLLGFHNVNVIKIGKFSLKGLFHPEVYHVSYSDESLYK